MPLSPSPALREQILATLDAALRAVNPRDAVREHLRFDGGNLVLGGKPYRLRDTDRVLVVGGGKASAPMAAAVAERLGDRVTAGVVTVKRGHGGTSSPMPRFGDAPPPTPSAQTAPTGPIRLVEAGHPIPDEAGVAGVAQMRRLLVDLAEGDLVLVLLSGGGSALLPAPPEGLRLEELKETTAQLLACGAKISEVNTVRKHCSLLAGGQLARRAAPARVATLILSDVVGSPLDAIASGPTAPDSTTFADALDVLRRYDLLRRVPDAVSEHLRRGLSGVVPETPKPGDPLFARVHNVIVGDNERAAKAACAEARRLGWEAEYLGSQLEGEAREVGAAVARLGLERARKLPGTGAQVCLVLGGETTVTVRGNGKGGRNLELALAAARELDGAAIPREAGVAVASLATDGDDGPTGAAGALAAPDTLSRARSLGLDAGGALDENDSYPFWSALSDLIVTGPTHTNVNDLVFVFAWNSP